MTTPEQPYSGDHNHTDKPEKQPNSERSPLRRISKLAQAIHENDPHVLEMGTGSYPLLKDDTGFGMYANFFTTNTVMERSPSHEIEYSIRNEGNYSPGIRIYVDAGGVVRKDMTDLLYSAASDALDEELGGREEVVDEIGNRKWVLPVERLIADEELHNALKEEAEEKRNSGLDILSASQVVDVLTVLKEKLGEQFPEDITLPTHLEDQGRPSEELVEQFKRTVEHFASQKREAISTWQVDDVDFKLSSTKEADEPAKVELKRVVPTTTEQGIRLEDTEHWVYASGARPQFYIEQGIDVFSMVDLPPDDPTRDVGIALYNTAKAHNEEQRKRENDASEQDVERGITLLEDPKHREVLTAWQNSFEEGFAELLQTERDTIDTSEVLEIGGEAQTENEPENEPQNTSGVVFDNGGWEELEGPDYDDLYPDEPDEGWER